MNLQWKYEGRGRARGINRRLTIILLLFFKPLGFRFSGRLLQAGEYYSSCNEIIFCIMFNHCSY